MKNREKVSLKIWNKMQDGIVYLFQYGIITEKKHFELLEELNRKYYVNEA